MNELSADPAVQDKHYLAAAIVLEGMGGLLFVLNNELGATLLVRFRSCLIILLESYARFLYYGGEICSLASTMQPALR